MATFIKQQINWIALVPRLFLLGILTVLFYQIDRKLFFLYAFFVYLIITYSIKYSLIPGSTFEGVKFLKEERFEEAMPFIQKDIDYYTKRSWIDRFRFLLMISSSVPSFREISLCNMAYCLMQTGRVNESKELYQSVLKQYPENRVAKTSLNTINVIVQSVK